MAVQRLLDAPQVALPFHAYMRVQRCQQDGRSFALQSAKRRFMDVMRDAGFNSSTDVYLASGLDAAGETALAGLCPVQTAAYTAHVRCRGYRTA